MKSFQVILIVIFIAAAIVGMLVFSGAIKLGGDNASTLGQGTVVIWGEVPQISIGKIIEDFNTANQSFNVVYVEKSPDNFDRDLLEALASGKGPDMLFLPDDLVLHYADKTSIIPYQSYSLSTFKNTFAGAGEVFLASSGILAFPMTIDPLMMYYNRSMLDANGIVYPPTTWDEMVGLVPTLTKKDSANKILKNAVALGQYSNINNAKSILTTLFMQIGNPIITEKNGALTSTLDSVTSSSQNLSSTLDFYTSFSDPNSPQYSWNRSFVSSRDAFSAENLAFYFGFASELESLAIRNPNQNFQIGLVPQVKGANFKLTAAHVTGLSVLSSSKNINTAFIAATLMASGDFAGKLAGALGIAPARRDLLAVKAPDAYTPIFYNSALYGRNWLDPAPVETDAIFQHMVESVLSNSLSSTLALQEASGKLNLLLAK